MERNGRTGVGLRRRWSWKLGAVAECAMRMFGAIAKRLKYPTLASVPVSAAMLTRVDTVSPEQSLVDVARLFIAGRTAQLPVIEHGRAIGVLTRDAVAFALQESGPHALVGAAPCTHVVTVAPSDTLGDVLATLRTAPSSFALVIDHGRPVGIVTEESLEAYAATFFDAAW